MLRRLHAIARLLAFAALAAGSAAHAGPITFTFTSIDGSVSFDGGTAANLGFSVTLTADTNNLHLGGGFIGSDHYDGLTASVSSASLGLSNVQATTLLSVEFGTPGAGAPFSGTTAGLFDGSAFNGLYQGSAIGAWDKKSAIGPLFMPATSSGDLSIALTGGHTLVIHNFDNAVPFADSSFQATTPVPEPGGLALGLAALGAAALAVRAKRG